MKKSNQHFSEYKSGKGKSITLDKVKTMQDNLTKKRKLYWILMMPIKNILPV